ncbi:MAG: N-ethylammeline chlorohydrolase, partial [Alphaproteobacteria bacterium]
MGTTWIKGADWVVAYDRAADRHVYLRDADVVFRGGTLVHVGKGYAGEADTVVDGKGRLILPGFVNI